MGKDAQSNTMAQRVEVKDGQLTLSGGPLHVLYGRRGAKVGCHFITYEALDKIYKDSLES